LQKETETLAHGQARPDRDHRRLENNLMQISENLMHKII
jgi:hypothetical protein